MSSAREAYQAVERLHVRDQLITEHLPLVQDVLSVLAAKLPRHVDHDALYSEGLYALMQAAENYDPQQASFSTYAKQRIRGAMLDELRRASGLPQQTLSRIKQIEAARLQLAPPATVEQIAAATELTESQVMEALEMSRWLRVDDSLSIEQLMGRPLSGGDNGDDPAELAMRDELLRLLTAAIAQLSDRERAIVTMYYVDGLRFSEIAEVVDLHQATVSRSLEAIRLKLGEQLRAHLE